MTVSFNDIVIHVGARRVERSGQPVHLSPKAFDLLQILIGRRPDVVRAEALRELLWPGVHIGTTSLPALVAEVRAACGESPRESSIRTLPRVGYAFVAKVDLAEPRTPVSRVWLLAGERWFAVADGRWVLGREGPGVTAIAGPTVSRRHAQITVSAEHVLLEDLGSKNGTWVDGQRLTAPTRLAHGDRFMLGSEEVRVSLVKPGATTQTVASRAL